MWDCSSLDDFHFKLNEPRSVNAVRRESFRLFVRSNYANLTRAISRLPTNRSAPYAGGASIADLFPQYRLW